MTQTAVKSKSTPPAGSDNAVRPFRVTIPESEIIELRRRIAATRWPTREIVEDRSQGVQLATLRELARYWSTEYDWRRCEARLNAVPQFTTEIDGVVYPGLAYFNEVDRGGHFAAWEEPTLFASEMRAAFKPLR